MIEFFRNGKMDAFIYSRIGQNHISDGQENQDCILFEMIRENAWVLALADGISSAARAKEGAQAAVDTVRKFCDRLITRQHPLEDVDALKVDIVRDWKKNFVSDWDEYAATLNFVIYIDRRLLAGQLGDGLIVLNTDGKSKVLVDAGDFYSTETYALGRAVKKSAFTIKYMEVKKELEVYMASDGIGKEIADESRTELGKYLCGMAQRDDRSVEDELDAWVTELGKMNGDDKSIGFVRWEEE